MLLFLVLLACTSETTCDEAGANLFNCAASAGVTVAWSCDGSESQELIDCIDNATMENACTTADDVNKLACDVATCKGDTCAEESEDTDGEDSGGGYESG